MLSREGPLTAIQSQALAQAVAANAETDPGLRTLASFRRQFRSVDDSLSFDNPVTGFDLTEIFDTDAVRTAWLSYVFRRIERTVEDSRPTLLVLDEAWKLLDDPTSSAG